MYSRSFWGSGRICYRNVSQQRLVFREEFTVQRGHKRNVCQRWRGYIFNDRESFLVVAYRRRENGGAMALGRVGVRESLVQFQRVEFVFNFRNGDKRGVVPVLETNERGGTARFIREDTERYFAVIVFGHDRIFPDVLGLGVMAPEIHGKFGVFRGIVTDRYIFLESQFAHEQLFKSVPKREDHVMDKRDLRGFGYGNVLDLRVFTERFGSIVIFGSIDNPDTVYRIGDRCDENHKKGELFRFCDRADHDGDIRCSGEIFQFMDGIFDLCGRLGGVLYLVSEKSRGYIPSFEKEEGQGKSGVINKE